MYDSFISMNQRSDPAYPNFSTPIWIETIFDFVIICTNLPIPHNYSHMGFIELWLTITSRAFLYFLSFNMIFIKIITIV